jgi:protein gp37
LSESIDACVRAAAATMETADMLQAWIDGRPPPNVWLGITVEDQQRANERIPRLLSSLPAVVHFLSCEPLLWAVDLVEACAFSGFTHKISWVIVGGESGHGARPFEVDWARTLRNQCVKAGCAYFVKQLGADPRAFRPAPIGDFQVSLKFKDPKGGDWDERGWPSDLRLRNFPEVGARG